MFSCEYCQLSKKILFEEHHRWLLLYLKFTGNYINREIDDKEDPITEDPKENPSNEKPKENLYYWET